MRKIPKAVKKRMANPKGGTCCACGDTDPEETPCEARKDRTHCEHWWDGVETAGGEAY